MNVQILNKYISWQIYVHSRALPDEKNMKIIYRRDDSLVTTYKPLKKRLATNQKRRVKYPPKIY